jgi:hypothetical protein
VVSTEVPAAASSLLDAVLACPDLPLAEVARTRLSVHYETGVGSAPVLCVCTTDAVLLPNAVVTARLPGPGGLTVHAGRLRGRDSSWVVRRWWRPRRPTGLRPPDASLLRRLEEVPLLDVPSWGGTLDPDRLVGLGPGLTPAGDDLVAAALVTARATGDPRYPGWREATAQALAARRTTAVSRGLLHHALDGYATPELADLLEALCGAADLAGPLRRLVALGHSSGPALLAGVRHTLTTRELRGAA